MSSQEIPDAAEGKDAADSVAQVVVWARRLVELGRTDDARQVYLDALDDAADTELMTVALARLEYDAGAKDRAAELLRKVLVDRPGSRAAVEGLARVLLDEGKADEAARVIGDATAADSQVARIPEIAELAGEGLLRQGRHAAAVAAFGPRAALTPRGRHLRRRAWWLAGGPLRRRRFPEDGHRSDGPPAGAGIAAKPSSGAAAVLPDEMVKSISWAGWLRSEERFDDARKVIGDAIIAYGRHQSLLACAAQVEEKAGCPYTELYLWEEAYGQAPDDADIVYGLALSVCYFDVTSPYVGRVYDALRILDAFPDQAHPKIRNARLEVRSYNEPSAARLAAAYRPTAGLTRSQARRRRRLLLRSAGPLGQLSVRVIDWIRDRHYQQPSPGPVPRISAESEAIARTLDSLRSLPSAEASQRLEDAMHEHGRQPSLLLASAAADQSEGRSWHRVAMAAEAARISGGNVDAVCELATALHQTHGYGTALQVLASLPADARATVKARITTANRHDRAGNPALAAAAYGDPRDLDNGLRAQRRHRLRQGLTQRLRYGSSGDSVAAIDAASFDLVSSSIARVLDEAQSQADDQARETLQAAIADHGRHPLLLLELARTERRDGDDHTCAALAREAALIAPEAPLIVAAGMRELWLADYDADALRLLADLDSPSTFENSIALRAMLGEIVKYWQLWAAGVEVFGRNGLDAQRWQSRRFCWWRSGGPLGPVRRRIENAELTPQRIWKPTAEQDAALAALALPDPTVNAVRGILATHRLDRDWRVLSLPDRRNAQLKRAILAVVLVAAPGVLVLVQHARWPSSSIIEDVAAAALCMSAVIVGFRLLRGFTFRRWLWIGPVLGAGAAYLLTSSGRISVGAGLALAVLVAVALVAAVFELTSNFFRRVRIARWQRREAETVALDAIVSLLGDLLAARRFGNAGNRREWTADLERLAVIIERDFPHTLRTDDQESQRVTAGRARGAADTLRRMKTAVAWPDEAAWRAMTDQLTGLARALAAHDFAGWPVPLPEVPIARPPRSPRRRVMDGARAAIVIFAPPLVAFLLPLAVPLSGPGVPWLRFATTVWALLGTIIALDPDWSTRIAKMRQWFDVVSRATPSDSGDNSEPASNPTGGFPSHAAETPRRLPPRPPRVRTAPRTRR
jgi:predicted negative regulator of RcsB-dependent stress response